MASLGLFMGGMISGHFIFVLLVMFVSLVTGPFFCGWLCPFGALQELMGNLGRFLRIPRLRIPDRIEGGLRFLRYLLLAMSIGGLGFVLFLSSPNSSFQGLLTGAVSYITVSAWVLMALFLLFSLFIDRPFCRYFCVEGAQYGLFSLGRLFSIKRDRELCVDCKVCDRICPMQVKVSRGGHVRNPQCNNCFKCIKKCPRSGALRYGWVFKINRKSQE